MASRQKVESDNVTPRRTSARIAAKIGKNDVESEKEGDKCVKERSPDIPTPRRRKSSSTCSIDSISSRRVTRSISQHGINTICEEPNDKESSLLGNLVGNLVKAAQKSPARSKAVLNEGAGKPTLVLSPSTSPSKEKKKGNFEMKSPSKTLKSRGNFGEEKEKSEWSNRRTSIRGSDGSIDKVERNEETNNGMEKRRGSGRKERASLTEWSRGTPTRREEEESMDWEEGPQKTPLWRKEEDSNAMISGRGKMAGVVLGELENVSFPEAALTESSSKDQGTGEKETEEITCYSSNDAQYGDSMDVPILDDEPILITKETIAKDLEKKKGEREETRERSDSVRKKGGKGSVQKKERKREETAMEKPFIMHRNEEKGQKDDADPPTSSDENETNDEKENDDDNEKVSEKEVALLEEEDLNEKEVDADLISFKELFRDPSTVSSLLLSTLRDQYSWAIRKGGKRVDSLPHTLLITDTETIWQQLAFRNEQISRDFRKAKKVKLLEELLKLEGGRKRMNREKEEGEEGEGREEEDNPVFENDEEIDEEEEEDKMEKGIFNVDESDFANLEEELRALEEEEDDDDDGNMNKNKKKEEDGITKKYPKSSLDDRFFSLAQMNEAADVMERDDFDTEGILDEDDEGGFANYKYSEFFGEENGNEKNAKEKKKKKIGKEGRMDEIIRKEPARKKSVSFAVAEGENGGEEEERVLLGPVDDHSIGNHETPLKVSISKIKKRITKLEEENIEGRGWELGGETSAEARDENTLLETHLQFDQGMKRGPEITEEFNEKLEAIILQRVKDKSWDDPVRIVRREERTEEYRNTVTEEELLVKKSLTSVYEKEYENAQKGINGEEGEKEDPRHTELTHLIDTFTKNVDALFHLRVIPQAVQPEIKILNNVKALGREEVGAMASTEEMLIAPEEVKKREKGSVMGREERKRTDKKRERRKKKQRQRAFVMECGEGALKRKLEREEGNGKKRKEGENGMVSSSAELKSTEFFSKLQSTIQKELVSKTSKRKNKTENISSVRVKM